MAGRSKARCRHEAVLLKIKVVMVYLVQDEKGVWSGAFLAALDVEIVWLMMACHLDEQKKLSVTLHSTGGRYFLPGHEVEGQDGHKDRAP